MPRPACKVSQQRYGPMPPRLPAWLMCRRLFPPPAYGGCESILRGRQWAPATPGACCSLIKDTKFTPLGVCPEDAEVLGLRRFTAEALCRLFNVPPPIVQGRPLQYFYKLGSGVALVRNHRADALGPEDRGRVWPECV